MCWLLFEARQLVDPMKSISIWFKILFEHNLLFIIVYCWFGIFYSIPVFNGKPWKKNNIYLPICPCILNSHSSSASQVTERKINRRENTYKNEKKIAFHIPWESVHNPILIRYKVNLMKLRKKNQPPAPKSIWNCSGGNRIWLSCISPQSDKG